MGGTLPATRTDRTGRGLTSTGATMGAVPDVPSLPEAPATVLDAVNLLEAEGYGASFVLRGDGLRCGACGEPHEVAQAEVVRVFRFEGPSDPDEEAIVYAIRCPVCGMGGSLVSAFGPGADPEVTDRLVMLDERFREQPDD
jgi:hypothetical protein